MNPSSLCCARCTRRSCAVHDGLDDAVLYPMYSTKLRSTRRTRRRCVVPDVLDEAAQYTTDSTTLCCTRCTRRSCAVHDGLDDAVLHPMYSTRLRSARRTRRSCVVQGEDGVQRCSPGRQVESRGSMEASNTGLSPSNGHKQWLGTKWVERGFEYVYIYLPGL